MMSSAGQNKVKKCSACLEVGHNKRTCPLNAYEYSAPPKKAILKQQMFLVEKPVIDVVHKILQKGFFSSKTEFYRHCIINELAQWIDLKELLREDE